MQATRKRNSQHDTKTIRLGGVRMTIAQKTKLLALSAVLGVPGNTSAALRKLIDNANIDIRLHGGHGG